MWKFPSELLELPLYGKVHPIPFPWLLIFFALLDHHLFKTHVRERHSCQMSDAVGVGGEINMKMLEKKKMREFPSVRSKPCELLLRLKKQQRSCFP